ncbi:hypothetical protein IWX90DRAFT_4770 [Phyllosticta citrichinensis]|uniref:Secreted protein n=1 Tax=Phyllosticta citrichinensis TaxID=1130410 RepID=A0ABR1Y557_9PEZI
MPSVCTIQLRAGVCGCFFFVSVGCRIANGWGASFGFLWILLWIEVLRVLRVLGVCALLVVVLRKLPASSFQFKHASKAQPVLTSLVRHPQASKSRLMEWCRGGIPVQSTGILFWTSAGAPRVLTCLSAISSLARHCRCCG